MDKALLKAYKETKYVTHSPEFKIKIGEFNHDLDVYLRKNSLTTWAFITAENPYSQSLSESENKVRNMQLIEELKNLNLAYIEGRGIPIEEDWTPENSFLVLDISRAKAIEFAEKFEQNAILFGVVEEKGELVLTN